MLVNNVLLDTASRIHPQGIKLVPGLIKAMCDSHRKQYRGSLSLENLSKFGTHITSRVNRRLKFCNSATPLTWTLTPMLNSDACFFYSMTQPSLCGRKQMLNRDLLHLEYSSGYLHRALQQLGQPPSHQHSCQPSFHHQLRYQSQTSCVP